jgi:guanosine-3',5'-bis(diphosphate) 3'-pyrophosphohydrolase
MAQSMSVEDQALNELLSLVKKRRSDLDLTRIKRAYEFAKNAHEGQFRMSGVPYVCHPVETAKILVDIEADEDTVIAGLLHDVPEDTDYEVEDIEKKFGKHVARIVDALTKLSKVHYRHSMDERQIQSLRKMFLETAKDVQVVVVKLADRLHNMSTLQYLRPDKQQRIASETMEIYAPLANLYGIYQLRRQLEDLCFMYLQPEEYARIKAFVHDHEKKRFHFIHDTIEVLKKNMKKGGVEAELEGRPKHYYSIYQKMIRDKKVLQDIFDYFAIRMIVPNKEDCYKALMIVHETFKPKPKRVKDYIALPKPNGYQSLHTTVIGLRGKLTEVQIRTEDMHKEAEYGAAAHTFYKDGKGSYLMESISKLKNYKNPESFIQGLQNDILQERIFVFAPNGEIVNLPAGATCLDYIFVTGTPLNKKVLRPIVNKKNYSLTGELQSGDRVEIVFGNKEQKGPERWWLEHAKTTTARQQIINHFKQKSFTARVEIGEGLLQQELDHESQGLIYQLPGRLFENAKKAFNMKSFEEVLAQIGEGTLSANSVYKAMFPALEVSKFVRLLRYLRKIPSRIRKTALPSEINKFKIRIKIESFDRKNLMRDLMQPFYDLNVPVTHVSGRVYEPAETPRPIHPGAKSYTPNSKVARHTIDMEIEDQEELIALFDRLEKIPGVIKVQRSFRRRQVSFYVLLLVTAAYVGLHPFVLKYLVSVESVYGHFWTSFVVYVGIFCVFGLMAWLRSMGNKTFPHFEETKWFWPLSFGLSTLALITIFVDDAVFDLRLQLPIMIGIALLTLVYLFTTYQLHSKRRTRHLNRLKESRLAANKEDKN